MMLGEGQHSKTRTNLLTAAGLGLLAVFLLLRCAFDAPPPDAAAARQMVDGLEDRFSAFRDGEFVVSEGVAMQLDRYECHALGRSNPRRGEIAEPVWNCLFWLTGADSMEYVTVLRVRHVPKSQIRTVNGIAINQGMVGPYDVSRIAITDQRTILRRHGY